MTDPRFETLRDLDGLLDPTAPPALIYKHSPICGVSSSSLKELARFADAHPADPIYLVDVIRERALSRELADRLRVRHESPQVVLVRGGRAVWHASHFEITAAALARAVEEAA